jgi:hypothetical protein
MASTPDTILRNNLLQYISSSISSSFPYISFSLDSRIPGREQKDHLDSKLLRVLVNDISSAKKMGNGGSDSPEMEAKKRKREMEETVRWLRGAALDPGDKESVIRQCKQAVLKMRREIYLKTDDVTNLEDLPNFASLVSAVPYRNGNPSSI